MPIEAQIQEEVLRAKARQKDRPTPGEQPPGEALLLTKPLQGPKAELREEALLIKPLQGHKAGLQEEVPQRIKLLPEPEARHILLQEGVLHVRPLQEAGKLRSLIRQTDLADLCREPRVAEGHLPRELKDLQGEKIIQNLPPAVEVRHEI
ncbi:MAG: hypothetical protein WAM00_01435 [Salegentibacter sp.]